uniref:geraniol 8-hydroxylase-like n=1 Tax=Erigeron canadensis TaxID=72917 RepID=UPI001CB93CB3|nr:geraniol 8-hydroxylase-like [Erigeron canadensis]
MAYLNYNGSWSWEVISNYNNIELIIMAFVTILLAILWYKITTLSSSSPSFPPGPRSLPIVGYLPFLGPELHKQFTTMTKSYGPIFKFDVGKKVHIVISTLDLVKEVVRDEDETFANTKITVAGSIITYGGQDIGFSNNTYWRNLRKIFVHEVLSNKNLEACSCFRRDEVRKTINNVFTKIGTKVDIGEIAFTTVYNVITSMVGGNASNNGAKDVKRMAELKVLASKIFELFGKPNVSDFFPSLAWFDIQGIERESNQQHKKLDRFFTRMIEERTESKFKKFDNKGVGHDQQGVNKKDFLEVLIELTEQKQINVTQMKGLMLNIMIGGTETVTTLVEWAMTEIIENHKVMKKVQEELAQVVGVDNIVEESHLGRLEYLDATIKETFRLHPIAPFLNPRSPNKDCIIGGYTIPKGCTVFLNTWGIHRDPRYWDNPLEFNPDRFLTREDKTYKFDLNGNNLKFLPFGSGRRVCPGIPLADKMNKYILASLLHSFNWSLPKGEKYDISEKLSITLKKQKPLIVVPSQKLPNVSLYI